MHDTKNEWNERAYRETVQAIARGAVSASYEVEAYRGIPGPVYDVVEDYVREAVQGSAWVIYDGPARAVCAWSRHVNAIVSELGGDAFGGALSVAECLRRAAYWAMRQDVMDAHYEARAELDLDVREAVTELRAAVREVRQRGGEEAQQ